MKPVVHQAASRKGGKVRKKKGFGVLSPEKLKEVSSRGGKASQANRRNGYIKSEDGDSNGLPVLGDLYTDQED